MTQRGWEELRPYIRDERPPDDRIIVVRGGPDTLAELTVHARRTHDAYVLDGEPLWGISVYCTLDDVGPASLDGLLRRFASYRVVHLPMSTTSATAGASRLHERQSSPAAWRRLSKSRSNISLLPR